MPSVQMVLLHELLLLWKSWPSRWPRCTQASRVRAQCTLASRREQAYARGHRNIQRFNRTLQRDVDDAIARLAGEPSQARALGAEHPRERPGEIRVEQAFLAGRVRAKQP